MSTTYTTRAKLGYPAVGDSGWGATYNTIVTTLDGFNALGALAVTPAEVPSASLNVAVAAGSYVKSDGTIGTYAGTASQAMTTAATNYVYLTDGGTLTVDTSGFPANTFHVRLAVVVAGASTITSVTDARLYSVSVGISQPASANQAAVGSLATQSLTASSGSASTTISDVGGSFSQTTLNDNFKSLATEMGHALTDLTSLKTLVNQLRADLVTKGVIKGSA